MFRILVEPKSQSENNFDLITNSVFRVAMILDRDEFVGRYWVYKSGILYTQKSLGYGEMEKWQDSDGVERKCYLK